MRGVEQLAHVLEVALRQRRDGVLHSRVLGDDVPRAGAQRLGQLGGLLEGHLAQAGHAEPLAACAHSARRWL